MGMKWDVITNPVRSFPELSEIANKYPGVKEIDDFIKWVCIRFDPGTREVQKLHKMSQRDVRAADIAMLDKKLRKRILDPKPKENRDENDVSLDDPEIIRLVTCDFFHELAHDAWEHYVSNQFVLEHTMGRMREPVSDEEKEKDELAAYNMRLDLSEKVSKIRGMQKMILAEITGGDERADEEIKKRRPSSPEEYARRKVTP